MAWMLTGGAVSGQRPQIDAALAVPGIHRRLPLAAALLAGAMSAMGLVAPAHAGAVLLSRQSSLQAEGGGSPGGFDLTDGTSSFDSYANDISNANPGAAAMSNAHQFSQPQTAGKACRGRMPRERCRRA